MPTSGTGQKKEILYVQEGHQHTSPIPQGVKAGGLIFLSAVRGVDPTTQKAVEDTEQQARMAFENVKRALAVAGAGLDDVVKIAVYMVNLQRDRPTFNQVWKDYFGDQPPARFAVQVADMGAPGDHSKFLLDVTAVAP